MPRTVKEHDVRKKEIIDTSERLFLKYGYEETSIEHIINEVGIAKGTFYHYFQSKDDLLDELVEQYAEEVMGSIEQIAEETKGNALERLIKVSAYFRNLAITKQKLNDYLHEDRNLHLHHRMEKKVLPVMAGCYTKLIEKGNEEGIFNVKHPYETAVSILGAANYLSEDHHEQLGRHIMQEDIDLAVVDLMERMLGIEEGKLIELIKEQERGE